MYVNTPASALVARSAIKKIDEVSLADAMKDSGDLCLTASQISFYFGDSSKVGRYTLGRIQVADNRLSLAALRSKMVFHPPQSFFFLSVWAKDTIDDWASFRG